MVAPLAAWEFVRENNLTTQEDMEASNYAHGETPFPRIVNSHAVSGTTINETQGFSNRGKERIMSGNGKDR